MLGGCDKLGKLCLVPVSTGADVGQRPEGRGRGSMDGWDGGMRPSRSPLPSVSPRSWTPTHSIPSSKPGSAAGWTPSPSWTSARSPRRTGAESRGLDVCPGGPLAQAGDRSSGEAPAPQLVMSWASSSGACPLRSGAWVCVRAVPSPSSFLLFPCSRGAFPETLRRAAAVVLGTVGSPGTQSAPQPSLPLGRRGPGAPLSFHSCARPGHWPCPWGAHVVKACSSASSCRHASLLSSPESAGCL